MVETREEEPEETSKLVLPAGSPLPPRKRLLADLKQNGGWVSPDSVSSASSVKWVNSGSQNCPKKGFFNISKCHSCGLRGSITGKEKLQTLRSEWRIVLLCKNCFRDLDNGSICSYCFLGVSHENNNLGGKGFTCCECEHLVHRSCVSRYRESLSRCESGSFLCVDCWVPKSNVNSNKICRSRRITDEVLSSEMICGKNADKKMNAVGGARDSYSSSRATSKFVTDSSSAKESRFSVPKDCPQPPEDVVKNAESVAKKAVKVAVLAKEKAFRKAAAARRAAEYARNALNLAALAVEEENVIKDNLQSSASTVIGNGWAVLDRLQRAKVMEVKQDSARESLEVVDDAELAFQLHRSMNSSQRISKNVSFDSKKQSCMPQVLKKISNNGHSLGTIKSKSKSGSYSVCGKLEACSEDKLFETPDHPNAEPSVDIDAINHDTSINDVTGLNKKVNGKMTTDMVPLHDENQKKCPKIEHLTDCNLNGEIEITKQVGLSIEKFERLVESSLHSLKEDKSGCKNIKPETPMKEEQASCSNKPINSSGDDNCVDSRSESYQERHGAEHKISSLGAQESTCDQANLSKYFVPQRRTGVDSTPCKVYKKRCRTSDQDSSHPNKRQSSMEVILDGKAKSSSQDSPLESQASACMQSRWQQNCSKASMTLSHASYQSAAVPVQASAFISQVHLQ